jgi:hypothetical protein
MSRPAVPPPITGMQAAAVLERAANIRADVQRARVRENPEHPGIIEAAITFYTPGRRIQRDTQLAAVLDGRTCGEILTDWLGPPPADSPKENDTLRAERSRLLDHTPVAAFEAIRGHYRRPPRSSLDWKDAPPEKRTPEGTSPVEVAEHPREADADPSVHREADDTLYYDHQGQRRRKMTRREMIDAGMTREQRHEQYRRQGGKHPRD